MTPSATYSPQSRPHAIRGGPIAEPAVNQIAELGLKRCGCGPVTAFHSMSLGRALDPTVLRLAAVSGAPNDKDEHK